MEWTDVYEEHAEYVFRFLMYFLGNREDAEDVTQETFLKAFHKQDSYKQQASIRTWLITIARHQAVDRVRRQQRGKLLQNMFRRDRPEPMPMPEEMLSQSETKRELYLEIQNLKPDYRAVVILKGIQELSNQEVADVLGWSESKVRVTFHRAVKSLGGKLMREAEAYGMV